MHLRSFITTVVLLLVHRTVSSEAEPFQPSELGVWTWNPIQNATCIDGTPTGVYLKRGNSTSLGIYLNGGGACFNLATCDTCAKTAKPGPPGTGGIFSNTDDRNPFLNFNWIAVPYCTGDVHIGKAFEKVAYKNRHFNGATNLHLIGSRAKETFPSPPTLVVTGESAGGFGALSGYDLLRSYWTDSSTTRGIMLDDSGPVVDDEALAPCLQHTWRELWNINASLPAGCPCIGSSGNLSSAWQFAMKKWSKDSFGLISSLKDKVISTFFAYGDNDCKKTIPVGYNKLAGGLTRLSSSGVPVYMISGDEHTHTGDKDEFYTRTVSGVFLFDWVASLVNASEPDPPSVVPE